MYTGAVSIIDTLGALGRPRHKYDLVVSIRAGRGKYRRTRMVALSPQYQLLNRLEQPIFWRQVGHADTDGVAVTPSLGQAASSTPLYWHSESAKPHICFRADFSTPSRWSPAVSPEKCWNLALFIPTSSGSETLVRVDCQQPGASGSHILMVRPFEKERSAYLVENSTAFRCSLWQKSAPSRTFQVDPHRSEPWAWAQPLGGHTIAAQLHSDEGFTIEIHAEFDSFTQCEPIHWEQAGTMLVLHVRIRGASKVLRISSRPVVVEQRVEPRIEPTQAPIPVHHRPHSIFALQGRAYTCKFSLHLEECALTLVERCPGTSACVRFTFVL